MIFIFFFKDNILFKFINIYYLNQNVILKCTKLMSSLHTKEERLHSAFSYKARLHNAFSRWNELINLSNLSIVA